MILLESIGIKAKIVEKRGRFLAMSMNLLQKCQQNNFCLQTEFGVQRLNKERETHTFL